MEKSVVFVCTGNTCRSPLAEVWFNKYSAENDLKGFRGYSAGLYASEGGPASAMSKAVAAENDVSLEEFRSRALSYEMVEEAFLLIGLTEAHCRKIISAVPAAADKVKHILSFSGGNGDVADPYGGTINDYRRAFADIRNAVENLVKELKKDNF